LQVSRGRLPWFVVQEVRGSTRGKYIEHTETQAARLGLPYTLGGGRGKRKKRAIIEEGTVQKVIMVRNKSTGGRVLGLIAHLISVETGGPRTMKDAKPIQKKQEIWNEKPFHEARRSASKTYDCEGRYIGAGETKRKKKLTSLTLPLTARSPFFLFRTIGWGSTPPKKLWILRSVDDQRGIKEEIKLNKRRGRREFAH